MLDVSKYRVSSYCFKWHTYVVFFLTSTYKVELFERSIFNTIFPSLLVWTVVPVTNFALPQASRMTFNSDRSAALSNVCNFRQHNSLSKTLTRVVLFEVNCTVIDECTCLRSAVIWFGEINEFYNEQDNWLGPVTGVRGYTSLFVHQRPGCCCRVLLLGTVGYNVNAYTRIPCGAEHIRVNFAGSFITGYPIQC